MIRPFVIASCAGFLALGCADLTAPQREPGKPATQTNQPAARPPAPAPTAQNPQPAQESIEASHILIAYQGAMRAAPTITRTKEAAKTEAERIAKLAQAQNADFAALAKEHSDDPSGPPRGGSLGSFTRNTMVKPFADAAFALQPGNVSNVVETDFGFHIIKRTK